MRLYKVKSKDTALIQACLTLLNSRYGKGSHYETWLVNGFRAFDMGYLQGQVDNPQRELYIMRDGQDTVCAMIIIQYNEEHVVFHKFCGDPAHKGAAFKLFSRAEKIAVKKQYDKARVDVFSPAFKLVNYYREHGYTELINYYKLEPSEYVKYRSPINDYGFMVLQKKLTN